MASLHFLEIDHSDVSLCTAIIIRILPVTVGDKTGEPCALLTSNCAFRISAYGQFNSSKEFLIHSNSDRALNEVDDWENSAEP